MRAVGRAMHWSLPPDAKRRQVDARLGLTYSPDPGDYDVRCRQDHVDRDRIVRTGNGPRLVEIAGWILGALEDAGGRIATRDVYRLGEAAGIDPRMLTAARTWYLDVLRPAGVVAARERRKRRGGLRARPGAFRSVLCTVSHVGASTPPTTEATPKEVTKW